MVVSCAHIPEKEISVDIFQYKKQLNDNICWEMFDTWTVYYNQ